MVKPHTSLTGPQLAGWTPKAASEPLYGIRLDADIPVVLPDGTVLRGDLYYPETPGRYPVLIAWSSYNKELDTAGAPLPSNEAGVPGYIVPRGYCHLRLNSRGTGKSGGRHWPVFSRPEQEDLAAAIEYVAEQPWCDGNVGMTGMSYFAISQYLAAGQRPSHLKAIFPYLGLTDFYRHAAYKGGVLQSTFLGTYFSTNGSGQDLSVPPNVRNAVGYVLDREWSRQLISKNLVRMMALGARRHPEQSWLDDYAAIAFDQPYDGPFYADRSAYPILENIEIPICIGSHWGQIALHLWGAFEAWHRVRSPKKMFIGPPEAVWPWKSFQQEMLAWYDRHLKGIENGYDDLPPVRYWLQGANTWRSAEDWPVPGAETLRLHLTTGPDGTGLLRPDAPDGAESVSWLAVPEGMLTPGDLDRQTPQVLRFATDPFERETEMVGPIRMRLTLASSAIDTVVMARLSDLAPDGRQQKLSFGWQSATRRALSPERSNPTEIAYAHRESEPLRPGEPVHLEFSLTPNANLFRPGHRLVLEIGSRPDCLGASFHENIIFFPFHAPPLPARNTLLVGDGGGCHLDIAVLR